MKMVGERPLNPVMDGLADVRKSKIKDAYENATVKCKSGAPAAPKAAPPPPVSAPAPKKKTPAPSAKAAPSANQDSTPKVAAKPPAKVSSLDMRAVESNS